MFFLTPGAAYDVPKVQHETSQKGSKNSFFLEALNAQWLGVISVRCRHGYGKTNFVTVDVLSIVCFDEVYRWS